MKNYLLLFIYFILLSSIEVNANELYSVNSSKKKQLNKLNQSNGIDSHKILNDYSINKLDEKLNRIAPVTNLQNEQKPAESEQKNKDKPKTDGIEPKKDDKKPEMATPPKPSLPTPNTIAGMYGSVRVYYDMPMQADFSASEKRLYTVPAKEVDLFTGKATFKSIPSFSIAVGNEMKQFYRWEMELGYIPIVGDSISNLATSPTLGESSSFDVTASMFSMHFMNVSTNHFIKFPILDNEYEIFIGGGIGIGYAFPMSSEPLASNFILPTAQLMSGIEFTFGDRSKIAIFYRLFYADFKLHNKVPFYDKNNIAPDLRPIDYGSLHIQDLFINGIGIEYKFYTG